jgi:hypothetical protein
MRKQRRKRGPSAKQRPPRDTCGREKPHSGAINAKRPLKVSTRGLGGGVRSHMRNRSPSQIPATREFWANIANFSTSNGPVNPSKPARESRFYEIFYLKVAWKICREPGKHFTISREVPSIVCVSSHLVSSGCGRDSVLTDSFAGGGTGCRQFATLR